MKRDLRILNQIYQFSFFRTFKWKKVIVLYQNKMLLDLLVLDHFKNSFFLTLKNNKGYCIQILSNSVVFKEMVPTTFVRLNNYDNVDFFKGTNNVKNLIAKRNVFLKESLQNSIHQEFYEKSAVLHFLINVSHQNLK